MSKNSRPDWRFCQQHPCEVNRRQTLFAARCSLHPLSNKTLTKLCCFVLLRNLSGSYVGESPRSTTDSPAKDALVIMNDVFQKLEQLVVVVVMKGVGVGGEQFQSRQKLKYEEFCRVFFWFFFIVVDQKRSQFLIVSSLLQLNLRSYNEELRQHLIEARKELEQNNRELALKKQVVIFSCLLILEWPVLLGLSES